jgi:hypothetical protein
VNDPEYLRSRDTEVSDSYELTLLDRHEGAIEGHSNVYLYRIRARAEGQ